MNEKFSIGLVAIASLLLAVPCETAFINRAVLADLSGRVINAADGSPIAGAAVALVDQEGATLRTGPGGEFLFEGLRPGTYRVRLFKGGFVPANSIEVEIGNSARKTLTVSLAPRGNGSPLRPGVVELDAVSVSAEVVRQLDSVPVLPL